MIRIAYLLDTKAGQVVEVKKTRTNDVAICISHDDEEAVAIFTSAEFNELVNLLRRMQFKPQPKNEKRNAKCKVNP